MRKTAFAVMILLIAALFLPAAAASAENITYDGVSNRIYALQEKFPQGMCWNHLVESEDDIGLNQKKEQGRARERFADGVTTHTCASHSSWETVDIGQYECNFFDGGSQCYGFARKIFYDVFGLRVSQSEYRYDYRNIQVGDYVRFGDNKTGHSFIVLSKDGNMVTALECNWGERCVIYWGVHTYDLEGVLTSAGGKEYSFNHYVHASNYDEINREYSTPTPPSPVLPTTPIGTYGVILGSDAYTTENPFYEEYMSSPDDCDNCKWYAWGRAYEKLGIKPVFSGEINTWIDNPGEYGTGTVPRTNSIAIWNGTHAAFIEKYEDGILYISESNFYVDGDDADRRNIYSDGYFDGDIYTNTFTDHSEPLPSSYAERGLPDRYIYLEKFDPDSIRCNFDGNDLLDTADAVFLLRNMMRSERYPVTQSSDVNGDGKFDIDDVLYLLRHIADKSDYPLPNV